jgi:hypothetical protein
MKNRVISWWLGTQPMFAICLDCDAKGIASYNFATLMPGRVTDRWFTGAGTCVPCYTDGAWANAYHRAPQIDNNKEKETANNG